MRVLFSLFLSHPLLDMVRGKRLIYTNISSHLLVMFFVAISDDRKESCVELEFLIWSEQVSTGEYSGFLSLCCSPCKR